MAQHSKETGPYRQSRHLGAAERLDPQWQDGTHVLRSGRPEWVTERFPEEEEE